MTAHSDDAGDTSVRHRTGVVRRSMTPAERRQAAPRLPWSDLASAPLNGVLAAVPTAVLAGLPLYLVLAVAGIDDPERWAALVSIAAFAYAVMRAVYPALGGFLRARARIDDDLLDDEVDDRVVEVTAGIEVGSDPPALYLQLAGAGAADGETIVLTGDYLTHLRRTGCFPSTTLRLVQLPRSRVVLGILPLGEALQPAAVSGRDHRPSELDGQPSAIDFESLRARAL